MAVRHGHLLQASSVTVSYDFLTSTNDGSSSSNLAKFTVSATGPRDPGTLTELVRLDPQNPFQVTAQYTQNSFAPVHDKTWRGKESFTVCKKYLPAFVSSLMLESIDIGGTWSVPPESKHHG